MHEFSLAKNICDLIDKRFDATQYQRVTTVIVTIGELLAVDSDALQFSFGIICKATVCADATLKILTMPGKAVCTACNKIVHIAQYADSCEYCGNFSLTVIQGEELQIKSMEVV